MRNDAHSVNEDACKEPCTYVFKIGCKWRVLLLPAAAAAACLLLLLLLLLQRVTRSKVQKKNQKKILLGVVETIFCILSVLNQDETSTEGGWGGGGRAWEHFAGIKDIWRIRWSNVSND